MELIEYRVLRGADTAQQRGNYITLFLVLENTLLVEVQGQKNTLQQNDIFLVEQRTPFALSGENALYVQYRIDSQQLRTLFPQRRYRFACNSTANFNDNYELLRRQLTALLLIGYENKEYQLAERRKLSYELIIFLVNNFAISEIAAKKENRIDEIVDYIDANCQEELSLKSISEHFYMTPQYFSRYFRKSTGTTFYKYLSAFRLERALWDMLNSDKNILHIAMDNGFPNTESFYHYFSEVYAMTPQEYRRQYRQTAAAQTQSAAVALEQAVARLDVPSQKAAAGLSLSIDVAQSKPFEPFWCEVVNLGESDLLNDFEGQNQFRTLQQELNFRYVRMDLNSNRFVPNEEYSFYLEERSFDYLVEKKLLLWLTIDYRRIESPANLLQYLGRLISHFANRYSLGTIKVWRFEFVYNTLFDAEKCADYWKLYALIQDVLSHYQMEEPLLGPGLMLGNWQGAKCFYEYMEKNSLCLPVQTFQAEPYLCTPTDEGMSIRRATDSSYLKNMLLSLRQNSAFFRQQVEKVYVTSWADSLLRTNIMNDSCYRGATIIKNVIDCFGSVQLLAHSVPLDVAYAGNLQGKVLFGGDGLLSKHGLRKPSFYAYRFLQRIGIRYLTQDEHSIVFSNGDANYQILCHNRKRLSYRYYLEEDGLRFEHFGQYFEEEEPLPLHYRLTNLKNGTYVLKIRSVSPSHGSVQDELLRMVEDETVYIHGNDLEYLRDISVPQMRLRVFKVTDGTLELSVTLEANEFALLHLIYQY